MKYYLISIFCTLSMCTPKSRNWTESELINISYYKFNSISKYSEIVHFEKLETDSFVKFQYSYKHLQNEDNVLMIYKDSVLLNGTKISLISEKVFTENQQKIKVQRYYYDGLRMGTDFYINKDMGLILSKSMSNNVAEYYPNDIKELPKMIIQDSMFFKQ